MSADASATRGLTPTPAGSTVPSTSNSGTPTRLVPSTANSGTPTGSGNAPSGMTPNTGSNTIPSSANDIIITEHIMSDTSWPANLVLNLAKLN